MLCAAIQDVLELVKSSDTYTLVYYEPKSDSGSGSEEINTTENDNEDGESSPKKRKFSHERFHEGIR